MTDTQQYFLADAWGCREAPNQNKEDIDIQVQEDPKHDQPKED